MIDDPFFYLVAIPAVMITGISKGGFGGGLSVIAVPLMSLAISPPQAAGIMLPVLCAMDLYGMWVYRSHWDRRLIAILVPAAVAGIVAGTISFRHLDDSAIRLMVGALALAFVADTFRRARTVSRGPSHGMSRWIGVPIGLFSGFTSFIAHAGGPPITAYFLALKLEKRTFVSTSVIFFTSINYLKLIPYGWLGQLGSANLTTALILAPMAVAGVGLGAWAHRHIGDIWFRRIVLVLLTATGLKLIGDGVMGML